MEWDAICTAIEECEPLTPIGRVVKVTGLIAEGQGPGLGVGSTCCIHGGDCGEILGEVVGFKDRRILLMSYGEMRGIRPGCRITPVEEHPYVPVGDAYLGRVVNAFGVPIDGRGSIASALRYPLYGQVTNPMERRRIKEVADVGVGAINMLLTIGKGQRVGIMAGSGVGKSVLMGMMARHTSADVSIIGLIGERGREVKDFVEQTLGPEGLKKAVVVAATSDVSPLIRIRGAYQATTLAEYFRDRGMDVLLIMDSITRFAMSSRDVGLAVGEPPTVRGYTPSFFAQLPKLVERAGSLDGKGTITGIYTVLVEGDDMNDPVGDAVRSVVDGHIVLSRNLANRGHYPAIDVPASVSRVMREVVDKEHLALSLRFKEVLATYYGAEDLISIGAYVDGSDARIDYAKKMIERMNGFLRQDLSEKVSFGVGANRLRALFGDGKSEKIQI
jgi:flagellum-specific ATP synthase